MIDRLTEVQALTNNGFNKSQAVSIVELIAKQSDSFATKKDIENIQSTLKDLEKWGRALRWLAGTAFVLLATLTATTIDWLVTVIF